jgi:hypothetical protein
MKAKIVITLVAIALLGLAGTANAGNRHFSHRDGHYRGHPVPHHYRAYRAPVVRYHGHRHYRSYPRVHFGYYGHHDHDAWKVAAGAVLLGSIIHSASHDRGTRVVYRERAYPVSRTPVADIWYRTDSAGDCFEVRTNTQGDEVWTLVDPGYCD